MYNIFIVYIYIHIYIYDEPWDFQLYVVMLNVVDNGQKKSGPVVKGLEVAVKELKLSYHNGYI